MENVTVKVLDVSDEDFEKLDENEAGYEGSTENFDNDWENPPKVKDLKQDYQDAQSDHDEHASDIEVWLNNLNIEGSAQPKKVKGRSSIQPKLIRKQAEWRYSSLAEPFLSTEDLFNVAPVTYEDKDGAIQNALVLNNQFNTKIDKIRFIDDYVHTATDEGTVIVRVGWDFEEEEQLVEEPKMSETPQEAMEFLQLQVMTGAIPQEQAKAILMSGEPIPVGTHMVPRMVTTKNQPTAEVCNYENVVIDPTCMGDMSKAGFVIYTFETNLSELKKDGRYSNLDKIDIEGNDIISEADYANDDASSFNFTDKPRKKFVAYEYWGTWDVDGTGVVKPIVATWVGAIMIRLEDNPYPDQKIPFVTAQYLPKRRQIYGEPDGELLEDNQKIVGAVTRGMIDIMGRSANGQTGMAKNVLDVTNKRKYDRGLDYEYNAQIDPRMGFHMHTFPEIPQSAGLMLQLQNNEAESLTGVKAFNTGITGNSLGDSVAGQKNALDATAKRELNILRRLAEGIKQIGRKIIAMNAEFLSEEEVVRVTNDEFVTVRRDDLSGNYDLELSISTAEADNDKAQELSFMLQTMGPNQDPELNRMMQVDIARLRKMPALAKQIEEYQPQPDPIAVKKAELEIQLLEAQIANEYAKAHENQANGELDLAKIGTEKAKAREAGSNADATDLKFVEDETGTTQARDVQKIQSQAEANTKMKVIDNLTKKDKPVTKK